MRSKRSAMLGQKRRRTVWALVPIVCPSEVVTGGLVDDVVDHVATTFTSFSPLARRALSAALLVIEVSGLRHGRRFSRLPPAAAAAAVARLSGGSPALRRLFGSVRDLIVVAYFDQPTVKDRLGYRPAEWTAATAARWHEEWGAEAERHRALLRTRLPRPGEEQ